MSTWDGKDVVETVPVDVPASLAGSIVQGAAQHHHLQGAVDLHNLCVSSRDRKTEERESRDGGLSKVCQHMRLQVVYVDERESA
jgi:hypothetical protein